jgi:hypothetical protein
MKRFILVSALVVLGLTGFVGSAEASKPSAAPGTGLVGACNMSASDTMMGFYNDPPTGPMAHDGTPGLPVAELQGNVGMSHAVDVSGCS